MACREPGHTKWIALVAGLILVSCSTREKAAPVKAWINAGTSAVVSQGGISYCNGTPVNGFLYSLYANGDTMMLVPYTEGRENGEARYWLPGRKLSELRIFRNGKKEETHRGWYANGELRFEYHYQGDEFHGAYKEWFPGGKLYRSLNFDRGHESGLQQVWFESGQVKSNYIIKNGRRYGLLGTKNCVNVADSLPR